MKNSYPPQLKQLFKEWAGEPVESFTALPPSGSDRHYYRITGPTKNVLGAINNDVKENRAFLAFSDHFKKLDLPVPAIFSVNASEDCYLLEDFGNTTLYDWLSTTRTGKSIPDNIIDFYKQSLNKLIHFQVDGAKDLDFGYCYPRHSFDKQSMLWDLHYFKYYFLKLAQIPFDEQLLEDDFNAFADSCNKPKAIISFTAISSRETSWSPKTGRPLSTIREGDEEPYSTIWPPCFTMPKPTCRTN
ncbi:MAG TPA: hypothetical protein VJ946_02165 [Bacteroidales bacterium]|nr:hypothetical protein [Bacteroidales bacterium]